MKRQEIMQLPKPAQQFLHDEEIVYGKSELTVLEYGSDLRTFFRFMKLGNDRYDEKTFESCDISGFTLADLQTVTADTIYQFLYFCNDVLHNSARTRARKKCSLRMFFRYLDKRGLIESDPCAKLDSPNFRKSLPKFLTLEESVALLDCVDGQFYERDYCILTLFLNCGLRLSELVGLNLSSFRPDGTMRVLGKGNKERILYLNNACLQAVDRYRRVRPNDGLHDRDAFFISRQKNRISPKTVQLLVKKFLEKAGIFEKGMSVHKLRHTAATLMYRHGDVDVMLLKEILGHENLATTQIYTHVADDQVRAAMRANPLAGQRGKSAQQRAADSAAEQRLQQDDENGNNGEE